jgi:acyl-CoA thioester hydrolase
MQPVTMFDTRIAFNQCDPNAHLNTAEYAVLFDRASWLFLEHLGVWDGHGPGVTLNWADVRATTEYKQEVREGDRVQLLSSLTKVGRTSIGLRHEMRSIDGANLFAIYESVTVRFDLVRRVPVPVPEHLRSFVD